VKLENRGFSDVKGVSYTLVYLARYVNLDNPEEVARFIANMKSKNS